MRQNRDSGAKLRLKSLLAAVLSLTLGVGIAGVAPAIASPTTQTGDADAVVTTASPSPGVEDPVDETTAPATEKTEEPSKSAEGTETETAKTSEEAEEAPAKTNNDKKAARTSVQPFASGSGMTLEKTLIGDPVVKPGGTVSYEIQLGCTSNTNPCIDAYLIDALPEPFVLEDVSWTGFQAAPTVDGKIGDSQVKLTFNETSSDRPGTVGINAGATYTITIIAKLPEDTPLSYDGRELVNKATLTSGERELSDDAEPAIPNIDAGANATISKKWESDTFPQGSTASNKLTLSDIKNTSKFGATSLKIEEPTGDSAPFESVAFTGFGEIKFPAGADELTVTYYLDGNKNDPKTLTASPNAPPVFPEGTDLSKITGFVFEFTSSDKNGGIVANGSAGSIELNTQIREGAATGVVNNTTSIVATLPNGSTSEPVTAKDSFEIKEASYAVETYKRFSPDKVVAGDPADIGADRNRSTAAMGVKNTSNQRLSKLVLKERGDGAAAFGSVIDFDGFKNISWPEGATTGKIIVNGTSYSLTNDNGSAKLPEPFPANGEIKSFEISFEGSFAPNAGFDLSFDVRAKKAELYSNTILGEGYVPGAEKPVTSESTATLTVVEPVRKFDGDKGFSPNRVEGIAGNDTTATLRGWVTDATNVDAREIQIVDNFKEMIDAGWDPSVLTVNKNAAPGAESVKIEFLDGNGNWFDAGIGSPVDTQLAHLDVPAGATSVRITFQRTEGSFTVNQHQGALLGFELKTPLTTDGTKTKNVLTVDGKNKEAVVTVDNKIHVNGDKKWNPGTIIQKPGIDKNPDSVLTLRAQNTSTFGVDKMSIVDPKLGEAVNPFDYMNVTSFKAEVTNEKAKDLGNLVLTLENGTQVTVSGAAAMGDIQLPTGLNSWADVKSFEYYLAAKDGQLVPRDAMLILTVGTELRDTLRSTETPVDTALKDLADVPGKKGYILPNTGAVSTERGADEKDAKDVKDDLEIITDNSVVIDPVLTKSFDPAGPIDFFATDGDVKPVTVNLSVKTTHEADNVLFSDVDPTFWNAFDFVDWAPIPGANNADTKIEYFTGGTFTKTDAGVVVEDGAWTTTRPDNGEIQGIRVQLVGKNFAELPQTNTVKFKAKPRFILRTGEQISIDGSSKNPGEKDPSAVENTATAEVSRLNKGHKTDDSTKTLTFNPSNSGAKVTKENNARQGKASAGAQVDYTITVTNNSTEPIVNPVVTDAFPTDEKGSLLTVEDEWQSKLKYTFTQGKFNQAPEGTVLPADLSGVTSQKSEDGTKLTFTFPEGAVLYPGDSVKIVVPTFIRAGVPASANLSNEAVFTGKNLSEVTTESNVAIIEGQAYDSRKLVREVLTGGRSEKTGVHNVVSSDASCYEFEGGYYRYPCIVETQPGGTAEWLLTVTNTGNVDSTHMEIMDVFPYVGDTGVTGSAQGEPRETVWSPTLLDVKVPELPEGIDSELFYLTGDPSTCKPTGKDDQPWIGCTEGWTAERPANPRDIKGIKLVLDAKAGGLKPGETVSLSFTTVSDTEMPEGAAPLAPAWNSFGYVAQAQVNGKTDYRGQEPIKTGITFTPVEKEKVRVGDYVWIDSDRNGRQDEGEKGIKDVTLKLTGPNGEDVVDVYGNPVLPTMTDENGKYIFENLPVLKDGQSYTVVIDREASKNVLAPYEPTKSAEGDRVGDSSDWEAKSEGLTKDGEEDLTLDFGFWKSPGKVRVGDYVWIDADRDGVQDDGEEPIPGVELIILDENGEPAKDIYGELVPSVKTDENGKYIFENLPILEEGKSYTVQIVKDQEVLKPYVPTKVNGGERDEDSSDWEAKSEGLNADGDEDLTLDFGFVLPKVSVGDYVWVDDNRNGLQEDGEKGIEGVVLKIVGPDGNPVKDIYGKEVEPKTTDKDGKYLFDNLPVLTEGQSYKVVIDQEASKEPLAPYAPTKSNQGGRESDSSEWEATSEGLQTNEDHDPTLDFGFVVKQVSVGDYVWLDTNRDGLQDENEKPIAGVVLTLVGPDGAPVVDINGKPVGPTTTDENGYYTFEKLPALKGEQFYTVKIDKEESAKALEGLIPTKENDTDSSKDSSTWEAKSETLTENDQRDPTLDFGFVVPKVSVGDYVWVDTDRDGLQGKDEKGIEGVVLKLVGPDGEPVIDVNGNPVAPVTTGDKGEYIFDNLPVLEEGQSYTVEIDREASAEALKGYVPTKTTDDNREEDSSKWSAKSKGLTENEQHDPTLDFGFVLPKVSVGDYVWVDADRDGLQGKDEKGIEGVVLNLVGPDGEPVTDIYGEPVGPVTTGDKGEYIFDNLPVLEEGQSYKVVIDRDASAEVLKPYVPTKETKDQREDDSSTWEAASKGLTENDDHDPTLDFGFVLKTYAVGDYVWVDADKDGVQGEDEVLAGVKVTLLDGEGNVVAETVTNDEGRYLFDELLAGEYQVKFELTDEQAAKYEFTSLNAGDDKAADSDADPATGLTGKFTLNDENASLTKEYKDQDVKATQGIDPTWDAGVVVKEEPVEPEPGKVTVGDYVWIDSDKDGVQDEGEKGIEGVVLKLVGPDGKDVVDVNGNPVLPVTTDKDGKYVFKDLPVLEDGQSYTVVIDKDASADALKGLVPTKENGGDRDKDSSTWEAKSKGLTNDGDEDLTLDFGFVVEEIKPSPSPTEPTPTEPTPTEPTPTEPTPTEPTPTEPTPTEPTPTEPTPTEPTPTEPTPTEPTPTEPTPTEPTPTEPTPTEPTPTEPTPTEPVDPTDPVEPSPSESEKPSETPQPSESADPSDPVKPTDPVEPSSSESSVEECPAPSEPEDNSSSEAPSESSKGEKPADSNDCDKQPNDSKPKDDKKDGLASTGFAALSVLGVGLIAAAAGVLLVRRNRGRHS